ncbi:MAG TPA: NepR family anti-sigma factor [Rhizomicrobium sp.]|nr:NepR family anti-sigma factor [Rhizomicrobium sp.]
MARAVQRQGWDFVKSDPKTDRNRAMKTRQRAIGRELRRIYEDVAKEPVPDEFVELLRQIDRRGGKGGQTDS